MDVVRDLFGYGKHVVPALGPDSLSPSSAKHGFDSIVRNINAGFFQGPGALPQPKALLTSDSCFTLLEKSVIQATTLQEVDTLYRIQKLGTIPLVNMATRAQHWLGLAWSP